MASKNNQHKKTNNITENSCCKDDAVIIDLKWIGETISFIFLKFQHMPLNLSTLLTGSPCEALVSFV